MTEWQADRFRALRDAAIPRRFAGLIGPVRRAIWLAVRPWLFHLAHAQDGLAARIAQLEREAATDRAGWAAGRAEHDEKSAAATAESAALRQALAVMQQEVSAMKADVAAERARRDFDHSTTRAELLAIGHVVSLCREEIGADRRSG